MSRGPEYVYVALIAAPPERVWQGLTAPEFTVQYWHSARVRSSFAPGEPIAFLLPSDEVGVQGEILECDFPHRLSYTWHFPASSALAGDPVSRVTFVLEKAPAGTKLTVIHDRLVPGTRTHELIWEGWPAVISGLKTLVETGRAVDFVAD
jgi:uncharacterized protein YndB with AHSA1/START domain